MAADYLINYGIRLPKFELTNDSPPKGSWGNSYVIQNGNHLLLNIGNYPTSFIRNWFAMHELGHILWATYHPLRWKRFRQEFGDPRPSDYYDLARKEGWKTVASWSLSKLHGFNRPEGQPSWYGAKAGGEERFCELIAFMYANGDFSKSPPVDLEELWDCCMDDGLSRMK